MQSNREDVIQSSTPYKYYIEAARTAVLRFAPFFHDAKYERLTYLMLRYGVRAPRVPGLDQYAPAWEVPDELAGSDTSRALRQIHHFKCLGQDLRLSCYKCQYGNARKS